MLCLKMKILKIAKKTDLSQNGIPKCRIYTLVIWWYCVMPKDKNDHDDEENRFHWNDGFLKRKACLRWIFVNLCCYRLCYDGLKQKGVCLYFGGPSPI